MSPLQRVLGDTWNASRTDWLLTGCLTPGKSQTPWFGDMGKGTRRAVGSQGWGAVGGQRATPAAGPPCVPSPAGTLGWESFSREGCVCSRM